MLKPAQVEFDEHPDPDLIYRNELCLIGHNDASNKVYSLQEHTTFFRRFIIDSRENMTAARAE
jgi:hypothetical protein